MTIRACYLDSGPSGFLISVGRTECDQICKCFFSVCLVFLYHTVFILCFIWLLTARCLCVQPRAGVAMSKSIKNLSLNKNQLGLKGGQYMLRSMMYNQTIDWMGMQDCGFGKVGNTLGFNFEYATPLRTPF